MALWSKIKKNRDFRKRIARFVKFDFIKNEFVLHICLRHEIVFSNINVLWPTIRSASDKRQARDSIDLDYDQIRIVRGYEAKR